MIYGYWFLDNDDMPRLPEVSTIDPSKNELIDSPYILFYTGESEQACVEKLKSVVVRRGEKLWWAEE